jgi:hypothetical protein
MQEADGGRFEVIPKEARIDADDPRYEQDVHIMPCTNGEEGISFGAHEPSLKCYCQPRVESPVGGRTRIIHRERVM